VQQLLGESRETLEVPIGVALVEDQRGGLGVAQRPHAVAERVGEGLGPGRAAAGEMRDAHGFRRTLRIDSDRYGEDHDGEENDERADYPFSSFFNSLTKRRSLPWAMIFCGLDLIIPAS